MCWTLTTANAGEMPGVEPRVDIEQVAVSPTLAELAAKSEKQSLETTTPAVTSIAEPGTLGLIALAGLMGGAVAMRRRLG